VRWISNAISGDRGIDQEESFAIVSVIHLYTAEIETPLLMPSFQMIIGVVMCRRLIVSDRTTALIIASTKQHITPTCACAARRVRRPHTAHTKRQFHSGDFDSVSAKLYRENYRKQLSVGATGTGSYSRVQCCEANNFSSLLSFRPPTVNVTQVRVGYITWLPWFLFIRRISVLRRASTEKLWNWQ
jgi:hypothetical protein